MGEWWRWALVSPDGVAPSRLVGVSASVNLPLRHKVQKFCSGTGLPGWSQKKGRKTVVCVCCVCVCSAFYEPDSFVLNILCPCSQFRHIWSGTLKVFCFQGDYGDGAGICLQCFETVGWVLGRASGL